MKKFLLPLLAAAAPALALAAHYDVRSETSKESRDCLIQDLRYPVWTRGHYLACFSQRFRTEEGWGGYFYGGIVGHADQHKTLIQICSWQMGGKDAPAAGIDFIQAGKNMSWAKSTWEGSAGGIKGTWPSDELRNNVWYRFVARTWQGPGDKPDHSFIGVWMKDTVTGEWYHLGTTRYPGVVRDLSDHFGFQENFGGGGADPVATVDIRNLYSRRNGAWVADNKVQLRPQGGERVRITPSDNGALRLQTLWETTRRATAEEKADATYKNQNANVVMKQPATPGFFDVATADRFAATRLGPKLYATWEVSAKNSPQLSALLEIFDNADFTGKPVRTVRIDNPDARDALVDIGSLPAACARLTLTDIFGRKAPPAGCIAGALATPAPRAAKSVSDGIRYDYFEAPEGVSWKAIPDLSKLEPVRSGTLAEPDLSPRRRRTNYAFRFTGELLNPEAAIRRFTLTSACGSRLRIDGKVVVDFDGPHSIGVASGATALAAGPHSVELVYFQGERQQQQADDFLQLAWDDAGAPQRVPVSAYKVSADAFRTAATVVTPVDAVTEASLSVAVPGGEEKPVNVQYYMTNPGFDYFAGQGAGGAEYFLGESADGKVTVPVWGASVKSVHARLIYGNGRTSDTRPASLVTLKPDLGSWTLSELEHHQYPVAARVKDDVVSLVGESMSLLTKPLTGDGELVARLADITQNEPGPDGTRIEAGVWQAGIILRHDLRPSPGEPLGGNTDYAALLGKADGSICFCDSLMKNGAGNQPSGNQGSKNKWMKIARTGNTFVSSVSPDGKTWKVVKTVELPKMPATLQAGFFLYALPSSTLSLHHAAFDHVSVTGN